MPEFTSYASGTPCWIDITSPELDRRSRSTPTSSAGRPSRIRDPKRAPITVLSSRVSSALSSGTSARRLIQRGRRSSTAEYSATRST